MPKRNTLLTKMFGEILEKIKSIFLFLLLVPVIVILYALPAMLLWNWLMPTLFSLPKIDFFQSLGLVTLSKILFGHGSKSD